MGEAYRTWIILPYTQAAQAYSLYFVWELQERAIYKTLYGNLPDILKW